MDMTTTTETVVRFSSPADLLGMLPYKFGFHPRESIVVFCLRGPRHRGGLTMRLDLPAPEHEALAAADLAARAVVDGADAAILVCYTDAEPPPGARLPREELIDTLIAELAERGITIIDALVTGRGRWWSYICIDPVCCPPDGAPLPGELTGPAGQYAAETVGRGQAVLASRAELAALIRPAGPEAAAGVNAQIEAALSGAPRAVATGCRQTLRLLRRLRSRYATGTAAVTDEDAARILLGLRDKTTRDHAVTLVLDPDAEALRGVLADVAHKAPDAFAAPVCTVLAWVAYEQGDGGLANVAIERALEVDPGYELAMLVDHALVHQMSPSALREMTEGIRRDLAARSRRR
jgi:hypothetical protein